MFIIYESKILSYLRNVSRKKRITISLSILLAMSAFWWFVIFSPLINKSKLNHEIILKEKQNLEKILKNLNEISCVKTDFKFDKNQYKDLRLKSSTNSLLQTFKNLNIKCKKFNIYKAEVKNKNKKLIDIHLISPYESLEKLINNFDSLPFKINNLEISEFKNDKIAIQFKLRVLENEKA